MEIIDIFLGNATAQLEQLSQAVKEGNSDMVKLHAHSLKGAAANVEAAAIKEVAYEIERNATDTEGVSPLIEKLATEFNRFVETSSALKHGGRPR